MADVSFCSVRAKQGREPLQATAPECTSLHLIRRAKTEWHKEKAKDTPVARELNEEFGNSLGSRPLFLYFSGKLELPNLISSVPNHSDGLLTEGKIDLRNKIDNLFAICTDGKKDPCCAKFAYAIYSQLDDLGVSTDSHAVEISHPGGCRFAPTLLCIPSGNCYGWVSPNDVSTLFEAEKEHSIVSDHYRGNVYYDEEMCWAVYFAASQTQKLDMKSVRYDVNEQGLTVYYFEHGQSDEQVLELVAHTKEYELHSGCFQPEGRQIKRTLFRHLEVADA